MSDVRICFLSHQRALQETMDEIEYQQAVVARAARLRQKYGDPKSKRRVSHEIARLSTLKGKLEQMTKNKPLCSDTEAETKHPRVSAHGTCLIITEGGAKMLYGQDWEDYLGEDRYDGQAHWEQKLNDADLACKLERERKEDV